MQERVVADLCEAGAIEPLTNRQQPSGSAAKDRKDHKEKASRSKHPHPLPSLKLTRNSSDQQATSASDTRRTANKEARFMAFGHPFARSFHDHGGALTDQSFASNVSKNPLKWVPTTARLSFRRWSPSMRCSSARCSAQKRTECSKGMTSSLHP